MPDLQGGTRGQPGASRRRIRLFHRRARPAPRNVDAMWLRSAAPVMAALGAEAPNQREAF